MYDIYVLSKYAHLRSSSTDHACIISFETVPAKVLMVQVILLGLKTTSITARFFRTLMGET